MKVLERKQPLKINQLLLDQRTGDAWKIQIVEALGDPLGRSDNASYDNDETIFLYGCVALEHDDERVVFESDIGSKFVPVDDHLGDRSYKHS